jgi:hypothetical protein
MKKYLTAANIRTAIIVGIILVAIYLLYNLFGKQNGDLDKIIQAKEETIKSIQQARKADSLLLIEKDKTIQLHEQRDSALKALDVALIQKYQANQEQHKTNKKTYEQIPIDINNLDKSELRKRISNY